MSTVKTLLCLFKDNDKMEFCIRNRNTDYLFGSKDSKQYYDIVDSDEICIAEECVRLNKFFSNNNFSVITILDAKNHYNRDQKQINLFKNQYIDELKLKGYNWNEDLDEFKIEYNDTEENREIIKAIENYRNLATLYKEKCIKLENEYNTKTRELESEYESKKSLLELKLDQINSRYNTLSIECNQLDTRIKNGDIKVKELLVKYNKLSTDIESHELKKEQLEDYINNYKSINKSLSEEFESKTKSINELVEREKSLKEEIEYIQKRKETILSDISKSIFSTLDKNELFRKLNTLIEMIKYNQKHYHGVCPNFEIDYLVKLGLEKSVIINKLKENEINISE